MQEVIQDCVPCRVREHSILPVHHSFFDKRIEQFQRILTLETVQYALCRLVDIVWRVHDTGIKPHKRRLLRLADFQGLLCGSLSHLGSAEILSRMDGSSVSVNG